MAEAVFGNKVKDSSRPKDRETVYQTLSPGRLVRIGMLTMETDADTQLDLPSPTRTIAATRGEDKGNRRRDDRYGDVLWRFASIRDSSDERMKGRGAWIGWTRDEGGKFTVPLMHPDSARENPTLGLDKL